MGRDEVLKPRSRSQHPSSSLVKGVGRAWVSAPLALWYNALVATGVVRHHSSSSMSPAYLKHETKSQMAKIKTNTHIYLMCA